MALETNYTEIFDFQIFTKLSGSFILGLLTTFIAAFIAGYGIFSHTLVIAYIIPVGCLVYGAMFAAGMIFGIKKFNILFRSWYFFFNFVLSAIGFFIIYYFLFSNSYVDDRGQINFKHDGEPLESFYASLGYDFRFGDYLVLTMKGREYKKIGIRKEPLDFFDKKNYVDPMVVRDRLSLADLSPFILEYIGLLFGSLIASGMLYSFQEERCSKCGNEIMKHRLFSFNSAEAKEIRSRIIENKHDPQVLIDMIDNYKRLENQYVFQSSNDSTAYIFFCSNENDLQFGIEFDSTLNAFFRYFMRQSNRIDLDFEIVDRTPGAVKFRRKIAGFKNSKSYMDSELTSSEE